MHTKLHSYGVLSPGVRRVGSLLAITVFSVLSGASQAQTLGPGFGTGTWGPAQDAAGNIISEPGVFVQAWAKRFTNNLPNALDKNLFAPGLGFVYNPDAPGGSTYSIHAGQTDWNVLGAGLPTTKVWGYGNAETNSVTYPGRTFEVQRYAPIQVNWENRLVDAQGGVLPHLLPVDQTITMQTDASGAPINGVPMAVHHHGGDTAEWFDGGPDQWITPQRQQIGPGVHAGNASAQSSALNYSYSNAQEGGTMTWYHDHGEGVTRINALAGLAGLYVMRDANENFLINNQKIPSGAYEVPLVIQDKLFTGDGSFAYSADPALYPIPLATTFPVDNPTHFPEMFGDVAMVNGVVWPNLDVEPREYRFRLLNGSDSRFYTLSFAGLEVYQISTDLGFLNRPVQMPGQRVTIAPGERMDIVVDFSKAQTNRAGQKVVVVTNTAGAPYPAGVAPVAGSAGVGTIMQFRVNKPLVASIPKTAVTGKTVIKLRGNAADTPMLDTNNWLSVPAGTKVRRILLGEGVDDYGRITPLEGVYDPTGVNNLGTQSFHDTTTENVTRGPNGIATEIWEIWNSTVDAHPIHLHLAKFRVLTRQPFTPAGGALEATTMNNGWEGVRLPAGSAVTPGTVATKAPEYEQGWKDTVVAPPGQVTRIVATFNRPGKYVYHCHILSHEEHDMMRWLVVQ